MEWGTKQSLPLPDKQLLSSRGREEIGRYARVDWAVLVLGGGGTAVGRVEVGDQGRRRSLYRDSGR